MEKWARSSIRRLIYALMALVFLVPPVAAKKQEAPLLAQSGWIYFTDRQACLARRTFGSAKEPITLQFITDLAQNFYGLRIGGKAIGPLVRFGKTALATQPTDVLSKAGSVSRFLIEGNGGVVMTDFGRSEAAEKATTQTLAIMGDGHTLTLAIGPLDEPLERLRGCYEGILRGWGLDPVALRMLRHSSTPISSPGSWVTDGDFPVAYRKYGSIKVYFMLVIDPAGVPTACHARNDLNDADLEALSCKLVMARARFTPGIDRYGNPAVSTYTNQIRWLGY